MLEEPSSLGYVSVQGKSMRIQGSITGTKIIKWKCLYTALNSGP